VIDHRDTNVVRIPIDQITGVNSRERGKVKFKQIVSNISNIGLKKPITVVQRGTKDGKPLYELVCGQGVSKRAEGSGTPRCRRSSSTPRARNLLLMSLAENLARRRQTCVEMLREVGVLKERGYTATARSPRRPICTRKLRQGNRSPAQAR
jgi:ParB family chromosome partitioning protein